MCRTSRLCPVAHPASPLASSEQDTEAEPHVFPERQQDQTRPWFSLHSSSHLLQYVLRAVYGQASVFPVWSVPLFLSRHVVALVVELLEMF